MGDAELLRKIILDKFEKIDYNINNIFILHEYLTKIQLDTEIRQGWIIEETEGFNTKPILYLVTEMNNVKYCIIIYKGILDISVEKDTKTIIFNKRPSMAKIIEYKNKLDA
jgi:hypothetical protein